MEEVILDEGRILGIDYGERKVGLALTDALRVISTGYKSIINKGENQLIDELRKVIADKDISMIVVGIPYSLRGGSGPMAKRVERFVEVLRGRVSVPVETYPERYTSVEAKRYLRDMGIKPSRNKEAVDKMAAALILRSYLDSRAGARKV